MTVTQQIRNERHSTKAVSTTLLIDPGTISLSLGKNCPPLESWL